MKKWLHKIILNIHTSVNAYIYIMHINNNHHFITMLNIVKNEKCMHIIYH